MTERRLPIPACAAICGNAMNQPCIEDCAPARDCHNFEPRKDLELPMMPQYPDTKGLTWKERFVIEEAYLKKTIDFIQGRKATESVYSSNVQRRPFPDGQRHNGDNRTEEIDRVQQDAVRDETI